MAIIDQRVGGILELPSNKSHRHYVIQRTLDFSKVTIANGDVVQLLTIPPNTIVTDVTANVPTAEGAALTGDIGDTSDPNGWVAVLDLNAVAHTLGAGALAPKKLYAIADVISLTMTLAPTNNLAVVTVSVVCQDVS